MLTAEQIDRVMQDVETLRPAIERARDKNALFTIGMNFAGVRCWFTEAHDYHKEHEITASLAIAHRYSFADALEMKDMVSDYFGWKDVQWFLCDNNGEPMEVLA